MHTNAGLNIRLDNVDSVDKIFRPGMVRSASAVCSENFFSFLPRTWTIPDELPELRATLEKSKGTFIVWLGQRATLFDALQDFKEARRWIARRDFAACACPRFVRWVILLHRPSTAVLRMVSFWSVACGISTSRSPLPASRQWCRCLAAALKRSEHVSCALRKYISASDLFIPVHLHSSSLQVPEASHCSLVGSNLIYACRSDPQGRLRSWEMTFGMSAGAILASDHGGCRLWDRLAIPWQ